MNKEPLKATFSCIGRDLFWKVHDMEDGFVRWTGYDDTNWWKTVSPSEQSRVRIGKTSGKRYEIDFETDEVTVTDPVDRPAPAHDQATGGASHG